MTYWRVVDTGPGGAGWNMAVDEAMLITAGKGLCPPTLRFFSWDVPSLSIGSFQKAGELNLSEVKRRGVPLVRRPTGGRAVLHGSELTYSVACPIPSDFFPSDLMGSYKKIGACFLAGLGEIGVEAALVPVDRDPDKRRKGAPGKNPLCFSSPSWYEVLAGGRKLIGSAQRRLKGSFLQQGSLLIGLNVEGLVSLMRYEGDAERDAARRALASRMTALNEHMPGVNLNELKDALVKGFEAEMGAPFVSGELSREEIELARRLLMEKYSREEWNLHRDIGVTGQGAG